MYTVLCARSSPKQCRFFQNFLDVGVFLILFQGFNSLMTIDTCSCHKNVILFFGHPRSSANDSEHTRSETF